MAKRLKNPPIFKSKTRDELTVGVEDNGGRLYCMGCSDHAVAPVAPVYFNLHDTDPCERCGRPPSSLVQGKRVSDDAPVYRVPLPNPCVRENPQDEDIRSIARTLSRTDVIVLSAIRFWSITPGTQTLWGGVLSVLHKQGIKSPEARESVKNLQRLGWVTLWGGERLGKTVSLTNAGVRASDVISRGVELLPWDWRSTFPDVEFLLTKPNPPLAIVGAGILANPHEGLTCWYCSLPLSSGQDLCPRCGSTNSEMYNPPCVPCKENPDDDLGMLVRQARTGDVEAYRKYVREAVRRGVLESNLATLFHGWGKTWTPDVSRTRAGGDRRRDGFSFLPWSGDDYNAMKNPLDPSETAAGLQFAESQQARALNLENNLTPIQRRDLMWRAAGAGDVIDLYTDVGHPDAIKSVIRAGRLGSQAQAFSKGAIDPLAGQGRKANPTNRKRKGDRGKKAEITLQAARAIAAKNGQADAFDAALKAHKTFHGVYPDKVTVYQVPDGKKKINRKFVAGLGRVPETHYYKSHPDGNKANTYWVHKHPPGGEPLEVLDPSTGLTSKIGGTFKVTSWWYH